MAESTPVAQGRIFISYRREETAYPAGWLYDRLAGRYGDGQIFKDVDSIELGDDFVDVITAAVGSCDVLLALIGDQWSRSSTEITAQPGPRVAPAGVSGSRVSGGRPGMSVDRRYQASMAR